MMGRWLWPAAAALAFAFLVGLSLQGRRPDIAVDFKPAGLLTMPSEAAREIHVAKGPEQRNFMRRGDHWSAPPEVADRLETAVRLLRNAAPLRILSAAEIAGVSPSEYEFDNDSLKVLIRQAAGPDFVIQFGKLNPLGSARYAKVDGLAGVALMPAYVAEAWERVL